MNAYIFADQAVRSIRFVHEPDRHNFGGPVRHSFVQANGEAWPHPVHMLFDLDASDPLLSKLPSKYGRLPLYFSFDLHLMSFGYKEVDDDTCMVFPNFAEEVNIDQPEIPEDIPREFPRYQVRIDSYPYNPALRDDAVAFAGVYGIHRLSTKDQSAVRKQYDKLYRKIMLEAPEGDALENFMSSPYCQGRPVGKCPNPECINYDAPKSLLPLAIFPANLRSDVQLFGCWSKGIQLIFELCPLCHTYRTSNQSG